MLKGCHPCLTARGRCAAETLQRAHAGDLLEGDASSDFLGVEESRAVESIGLRVGGVQGLQEFGFRGFGAQGTQGLRACGA